MKIIKKSVWRLGDQSMEEAHIIVISFGNDIPDAGVCV